MNIPTSGPHYHAYAQDSVTKSNKQKENPSIFLVKYLSSMQTGWNRITLHAWVNLGRLQHGVSFVSKTLKGYKWVKWLRKKYKNCAGSQLNSWIKRAFWTIHISLQLNWWLIFTRQQDSQKAGGNAMLKLSLASLWRVNVIVKLTVQSYCQSKIHRDAYGAHRWAFIAQKVKGISPDLWSCLENRCGHSYLWVKLLEVFWLLSSDGATRC